MTSFNVKKNRTEYLRVHVNDFLCIQLAKYSVIISLYIQQKWALICLSIAQYTESVVRLMMKPMGEI